MTENGTPNGTPYVVLLAHDWGCTYAWVRPDYDSALHVLRAWFIIELIEVAERDPDVIEGCPDPASISLDEMIDWIIDKDLGWEIILFPMEAPTDPLRGFYENGLGRFPETEQERIKRNVIRAVGRVLGWSPIEDYEKLSIDQLPSF